MRWPAADGRGTDDAAGGPLPPSLAASLPAMAPLLPPEALGDIADQAVLRLATRRPDDRDGVTLAPCCLAATISALLPSASCRDDVVRALVKLIDAALRACAQAPRSGQGALASSKELASLAARLSTCGSAAYVVI